MLICSTQSSDIPSLVALSYKKRKAYEKEQPQFWKYAEKADAFQEKWFEELLIREDYILLNAKSDGEIIGFIIGRLIEAPEVYDPGGMTLMIDDFVVKGCLEENENIAESGWSVIGRELVDEVKSRAKRKGASQMLIVCGAHDQYKQKFLKNIGLRVVSEWYTQTI